MDHAGDADVPVLTVKTLKGHLGYAGTGWPEREQYDALGPLLAGAHARDKQVWACSRRWPTGSPERTSPTGARSGTTTLER